MPESVDVMRESLNPVNGHLWSKNGPAWHVPPVSTNMSHRPQWTTQLLASLSFKGKWYHPFKICELWKRPQKTLLPCEWVCPPLKKFPPVTVVVSERVAEQLIQRLSPCSNQLWKGKIFQPHLLWKERFSNLSSFGKEIGVPGWTENCCRYLTELSGTCFQLASLSVSSKNTFLDIHICHA